MPLILNPSIFDIALRLILTFIAGTLIGLNRESRGHAAGLRTTILICLAAAVAMIQANLIFSAEGKTPESFVSLDIMRLPLGILTGVGFIGGGTILRKGDLITGVTTAATLWIGTIIGLCFGGGQILLGITATILCLSTLMLLKKFDAKIAREHRATLVINADFSISNPPDLTPLLKPIGFSGIFKEGYYTSERTEGNFQYEIHWKQVENASPHINLLKALEKHYFVKSFKIG